jgi:hypothetical protein
MKTLLIIACLVLTGCDKDRNHIVTGRCANLPAEKVPDTGDTLTLTALAFTVLVTARLQRDRSK